jgi:hypothetical protein
LAKQLLIYVRIARKSFTASKQALIHVVDFCDLVCVEKLINKLPNGAIKVKVSSINLSIESIVVVYIVDD